jgi:hypothetical protein
MKVPEAAPPPVMSTGGLNLWKLPPECWRPFESGNKRKSGRIGERELERISASLRVNGGTSGIPVQLRDFSCTGFGIHLAPGSQGSYSPKPGETVQLALEGPWPDMVVVPCEVRNDQRQGDGLRIGLGRLDLDPAEAATPEGHGLSLGPEACLQAQVANCILYNEWSDAVLVEIRGAGEWVFESRDSSLLLFRGLEAEFQLDLPLDEEAACTGRVRWMLPLAEGGLRFCLAVEQPGPGISNALGEHLLRSQACAPKELRSLGVCLQRFRDELRFQFVSTLDEYSDVLNLRAHAYRMAGKLAPDTTPAKLVSKLDRRTRFLAAYHGDLMVACVALTFADREDSPLRSEGEFRDGRYPVPVPAKTRMIELHSLCTHKDYRGGDLAKSMIEHCARALLLSDRDWYITFITGDLLPLYRRIGFREAGARAPIKALGGIEHHLVLLHKHAFLLGKGISPASWHHFFADLVQDLLAKGFVQLTARQRFRIAAYRLVGSLARRWLKAATELEFRSFLRTARTRISNHD